MDMLDVDVHHHFADRDLYAKEIHIPEGYTITQHIHNYSHLSIVGKGVVRVTVDDVSRVYKAGQCVNIKAGSAHEIEALTDAIWYCIHACAEKDPDKVDEVILSTP